MVHAGLSVVVIKVYKRVRVSFIARGAKKKRMLLISFKHFYVCISVHTFTV